MDVVQCTLQGWTYFANPDYLVVTGCEYVFTKFFPGVARYTSEGVAFHYILAPATFANNMVITTHMSI